MRPRPAPGTPRSPRLGRTAPRFATSRRALPGRSSRGVRPRSLHPLPCDRAARHGGRGSGRLAGRPRIARLASVPLSSERPRPPWNGPRAAPHHAAARQRPDRTCPGRAGARPMPQRPRCRSPFPSRRRCARRPANDRRASASPTCPPASPNGRRTSSFLPALDLRSRHPLDLADIDCRDDTILRQRVSGDQHVVASDGLARSVQRRTDAPVSHVGKRLEGQAAISVSSASPHFVVRANPLPAEVVVSLSSARKQFKGILKIVTQAGRQPQRT